MQKIDDILDCIREMAPEELAEPWDNSGLLVASGKKFAERVVVCLDVTAEAVSEAVNIGAQLIIAHHPLLFTPIKRMSQKTLQGKLLYELIRNDIALYAAHTNVDKTYGGLNDLLAGIVGLDVPIPGEAAEAAEPAEQSEPSEPSEPLSYYRLGYLPDELSIDEFNEHVGARLKQENLIVSVPAAHSGKKIKKVAVMCGSYSFDTARLASMDVDALVCGEIKYHDALDVAGMGIHIVQAGHHGTERFFIKLIGKWIADKYPDMQIHGVGFESPPSEIYYGRKM